MFKRLKNIEDKNKKLLEVKNNTKGNIKEVTDFVDQRLSLEAKELIEEIKAKQKDGDYRKLTMVVTMLIMNLVITKHLRNYFEIFITKKLQ